MKNTSKILTLVSILVLCVFACTKDNSFKGDTSLTGKWKVVGNVVSNGGPTYFVKATNYTFVEFKTDKTLGGTSFGDFKNYRLKDSITLHLTKTDTTVYQNYYYKIKGDSLFVSPRDPARCIEGCSTYFVKEN